MARRTWEQYEQYILQQWPLTRREVEVTLECIKGKKNKEIASLLGIGAETVNKTLDHVYRATGVNGRDQLVAKLLVADIDNTPLQQTLTLAGAGAALVGAGFIATLYASRSERKRPRSLRPAFLTSNRSEAADLALTSIGAETVKQAPADLQTSERHSATEENRPTGTDDLTWMILPDSLMETAAAES